MFFHIVYDVVLHLKKLRLFIKNSILDEDEYEDSYDYATDDSSWRVRRAAIHIISTLLKYRKDLVNEISSRCVLDLVKRLREKDENIRLK